MPLPPIEGHADVRALLSRALELDSLPQSILLHGPPGIGKERLGLWLAQLLVCEQGGPEPCGSCSPCRLALRLEHPDVHWFFPLPRPDATSPEKLRERLEESRAAELQAWRQDPYRQPAYEKAPAYFLAAVRSIQQLASMRPSMGARNVFVIGDAELMVPQESSQEAANAFLKLLEEPPRHTTLVLTSSQPGALLPTIRSRVLSLRMSVLEAAEIERALAFSERATAADAGAIAARAKGSIRRAFRLASAEGDEESDPLRKAGRELLFAALASGPLTRLGAAHSRRPAGARNDLVGELDSFAEWLRDLAATITGATDRISDPANMPILRRVREQREVPIEGILTAIERVGAARELAMGNVNPQLIVAELLARVQSDLRGPSARARTARS